MPRTIILDSFPLSSTAKREPAEGASPTVLDQCHMWIKDCVSAGNRIIAPAIIYYEVLRELERLNATVQIKRLKTFCHAVPDRYVSLTDSNLEHAAKLWADIRNTGFSTASNEALDVDVILAAQVLGMNLSTNEYVVATSNVRHLSHFVPADLWTNIEPEFDCKANL